MRKYRWVIENGLRDGTELTFKGYSEPEKINDILYKHIMDGGTFGDQIARSTVYIEGAPAVDAAIGRCNNTCPPELREWALVTGGGKEGDWNG